MLNRQFSFTNYRQGFEWGRREYNEKNPQYSQIWKEAYYFFYAPLSMQMQVVYSFISQGSTIY